MLVSRQMLSSLVCRHHATGVGYIDQLKDIVEHSDSTVANILFCWLPPSPDRSRQPAFVPWLQECAQVMVSE